MSEAAPKKETLPLLPIKRSVLFPFVLMPLSVGRPSTVAAVEAAVATEEKEIVIIAQKDPTLENPEREDLFTVGTRAVVKKLGRPREGMLELIVEGVERVILLKVEPQEGYQAAQVLPFPLPQERTPEVEALHRAVMELAGRALSLAKPQSPVELSQLIGGAEEPLRMVYLLGSILSLETEKEQALLEAQTVADALRLMHTYLSYEVQVLELRNKITSQAQTEMSREQREYLLRQQLRAIQQELGEQSSEQAEVDLLREKAAKVSLPDNVRAEVERELSRLERMNTASPEYNLVRTYLELLLELPWTALSEDSLDLARARQVLDEDHYDLDEIKGRILEHLGVMKLNPLAKAPILCFVGPPGVGKTSLGQSIARALGRKFERMSLGGMHDEAELRGHRRTYIGAMPGRIIQAIRRAGVRNPVLMLDEVDKLGRDFRGDPAAALLEVLDPEQNREFRDNYLDVPFDLSRVFFVTTANALDTIPRPLLDRMELLRLSGYTEEEKVQIARQYLIPRQLSEAGLKAEDCTISDQTVRAIVSRYTREAGLRQLERRIGRIARKAALMFAEGRAEPVQVTPDDLADLLGTEEFYLERARQNLPNGVATGLAWTESGGDVLYVEAALLPEGKGLTLTGQLGDVMKESAQAAQSHIWSQAQEMGIDRSLFKDSGVHIHVPAGATPKDGPSAGVTMAVALTSLYSRKPVRRDTAMTGEITLTGLVMPVGGIKEKVLAARRAGIDRVILPEENRRNLRDLPEDVQEGMEFIFAETIEDVIAAAIPELAAAQQPA